MAWDVVDPLMGGQIWFVRRKGKLAKWMALQAWKFVLKFILFRCFHLYHWYGRGRDSLSLSICNRYF